MATAFTMGVAQDLIEGAPLGLSSPGLMLATLLLLYNYQRIRQFDLLQQSLAILGLMLLSAGMEQWLRNGIDVPAAPWAGVAGMICSMLFWVPIRTVLRHSRRYYEVY